MIKVEKIRSQIINLESGLEVIINHSSRHKCKYCNEEVFWALVQIELVGLAKWELHKCKEMCVGCSIN